MVPWHPPCALCSLIFSSLILRPIVVTLFQYVSQLPLCPILRIATGLSKSFSVQLSRCSPVSVLFWLSFLCFRQEISFIQFSTGQGQALKTIQISTQFQQLPLTRCASFCMTCALAFILVCFRLLSELSASVCLPASFRFLLRSTFGSASTFRLPLSP